MGDFHQSRKFQKKLERANWINFLLFFANIGLYAILDDNLTWICVCILVYNFYRHFKLSNIKEGDDF